RRHRAGPDPYGAPSPVTFAVGSCGDVDAGVWDDLQGLREGFLNRNGGMIARPDERMSIAGPPTCSGCEVGPGRRRLRVAGGIVQSREMRRATQSPHLRQM